MAGPRYPFRWGERILFSAAGFLIGWGAFAFDPTRIDPKITEGELFTGFVTVVLAWVVSIVIEKEKSRSTSLNGLLLDRIEEIRLLFREVHALSQRQAGSVYSRETNAQIIEKLRAVSILLADLEELSNELFKENLFELIKQHYFHYKRIVTGISAFKPLTADKMNEVEIIYRDIRGALTKITVRVYQM